MNINDYRSKINEIDQKILSLLEERMKISTLVGRYKFENSLPVVDLKREKEVLGKTNKLYSHDKIKEIYQLIISKSKELQKYDYFLVGKQLVYSFSPNIYQMFGLENYNLYETDSFSNLLQLDFKGMNITNPYKEDAYKACTKLSEEAIQTKVVNTILKKDNDLVGYNTDYFGIYNLINHYQLDLNGKKVIIIGNGATSRTIHVVLEKHHVQQITHLVRNIRNDSEYLISDYQKFSHYDYIFNATSYGTYPNFEEKPLFPLQDFSNLKAVVDVVYNPEITPLMLEAQKYNIKAINGLYMLVSQAAQSFFLYQNKDIKSKIDEVYIKLKQKKLNIVLIGMPYSGKTTLGQKLSIELNREVVDIDNELSKDNYDIISVLKTHDISFFRTKEEEYTIKFGQEWGRIISCGGGIVLNDKAMKVLKTNGIIIFINTSLSELYQRIDDNRPIVKSRDDLDKLYEQRIPLYHQYADIIITNETNIEELLEKINENISDKWA